jgi:hypothetical protein
MFEKEKKNLQRWVLQSGGGNLEMGFFFLSFSLPFLISFILPFFLYLLYLSLSFLLFLTFASSFLCVEKSLKSEKKMPLALLGKLYYYDNGLFFFAISLEMRKTKKIDLQRDVAAKYETKYKRIVYPTYLATS